MTMKMPSKFAFLDEGEAVRRLGVDRDTLVSLVRSGRLRAYPGVGKGNFFKLSDLLALAREIHPADESSGAEPPAPESGESGAAAPPPKRPQHDPAYRVHLRLQADLKWYDLSDADFQAWVRELHPDAYARQRTNITSVIAKLERLVTLMDEAAAGWQNLASRAEPNDSTPAHGPAPTRPGSTPGDRQDNADAQRERDSQ